MVGPGGGGGRKPRVGKGISLDKFASARLSKYDKRIALEQKFKKNAKKVNKFRKVVKHLAEEGRLSEAVDYEQLEAHMADPLAERASVSRKSEVAMRQDDRTSHQTAQDRAQARMGSPPPDSEDEAAPGAEDSRDQHGRHTPQGKATKKGKRTTDGGEVVKRGKLQGTRHKPLSRVERMAADVKAQRDAKNEERAKVMQAKAEHDKKVAATKKVRTQKKKEFMKKNKKGQPVMKYRVESILAKLQQ